MAATSNVLLVSAASAWEIATQVRLGRLPGAEELAADFQAILLQEGFATLDITADHALRAELLSGPLRDPFDQMLISQSQSENLPIVTNDRIFKLRCSASLVAKRMSDRFRSCLEHVMTKRAMPEPRQCGDIAGRLLSAAAKQPPLTARIRGSRTQEAAQLKYRINLERS
jgi:PIN domain nuclease of toxin-antitoxin system